MRISNTGNVPGLLIRCMQFSLGIICLVGTSYAQQARRDSVSSRIDSILAEVDAVRQGYSQEYTAGSAAAPGQPVRRSKKTIDPKAIEEIKGQIAVAEKEIDTLRGSLSSLEVKRKEMIEQHRKLVQHYQAQLDQYTALGFSAKDPEVIKTQKRLKKVHMALTELEASSFAIEGEDVVEKALSFHESLVGYSHGAYAALDESKFKFRTFGAIESETFYSSRQLIGIVDNYISLLPALCLADCNRNDIHDRGQFYLSGIRALAGFFVEGPKVCNAVPFGDISAEFWGPLGIKYIKELGVSGFQASNGFIFVFPALYLMWERASLLFGYAWHPMYDPQVSCSPERVSFYNAIAEPVFRSLQVRSTLKVGEWGEVLVTLMTKIDEKSRRLIVPSEVKDPEHLWNPSLMGFHIQARALKNGHVFAIGGDFQAVKPRLFYDLSATMTSCYDSTTTSTYETDTFSRVKTDDNVWSAAGMAYMRLDFNPIMIHAKIIGGSQISHPLGGYAIIKKPINECCDEGTCKIECLDGKHCFESMRFISLMAGIALKKKVEPGLYVDYTKNIGTKSELCPRPCYEKSTECGCGGDLFNTGWYIFKLVPSVDTTLTISPRLVVHLDPIALSGEIEYQKINFGEPNCKGEVKKSESISNVRLIFSFKYAW